jgi:hypothetical protein
MNFWKRRSIDINLNDGFNFWLFHSYKKMESLQQQGCNSPGSRQESSHVANLIKQSGHFLTDTRESSYLFRDRTEGPHTPLNEKNNSYNLEL